MALYDLKVLLLGEARVGKTSLVLRYVADVFNESHQSTGQASFLQKQLYLEQDLVKLSICDTGGRQELLTSEENCKLEEANAALLLYDVTNAESLKNVRHSVKQLNRMIGLDNIKLAIVGNKLDLLNAGSDGADPSTQSPFRQSNQVIEEALEFVGQLLNAKHYLTSAKLGFGIQELFISLARIMVRHLKSRKQPAETYHSRRYLETVPFNSADWRANQGAERRKKINLMDGGSRSKEGPLASAGLKVGKPTHGKQQATSSCSIS